MKKLLGNLWLWVVMAFVLLILAWYFTIKVANENKQTPIEPEEVIERQPPT